MKPTSPLLFALLLLLTGSVLAETSDYKIGAKIFHDRCVLCHGGRGMGEGFLPLKLENYPNTNLLANAKVTDREKVFNIIARGGSLENVSEFMPPMGNELTFQELNTVTDFVLYLRTDSSAAAELLTQAAASSPPDKHLGNRLYATRCALCHGKFGEGDGRMAKIITSPPPANLVNSRVPDEYLVKIISDGGKGVGRSEQMPPWSSQLSEKEIQSVILYLKSLRH